MYLGIVYLVAYVTQLFTWCRIFILTRQLVNNNILIDSLLQMTMYIQYSKVLFCSGSLIQSMSFEPNLDSYCNKHCRKNVCEYIFLLLA
jgi:hypothetical protein